MIERGPARECEMILAFLKAEADSPRWANHHLLPRLSQTEFSRSQLIEQADLADNRQNAVRRAILRAYRGFGANDALFRGFPDDVTWRRVEIEPTDHGRLRYANAPPWMQLSDGTRLVARLAGKLLSGAIPPDPANYVKGIQSALVAGEKLPELIAGEGSESSLILIEGHCRATAYVGLEWKENIPIFLGSSSNMCGWEFY